MGIRAIDNYDWRFFEKIDKDFHDDGGILKTQCANLKQDEHMQILWTGLSYMILPKYSDIKSLYLLFDSSNECVCVCVCVCVYPMSVSDTFFAPPIF